MYTITTKHEGKNARVHHNGDWSGTTTVTWHDADGTPHKAEVPGVCFVAAARRIVDRGLESIEERLGTPTATSTQEKPEEGETLGEFRARMRYPGANTATAETTVWRGGHWERLKLQKPR